MTDERETDDGTRGSIGSGDRYAATASAYDVFATAYRPTQMVGLEALRPRLLPDAGPILDVGAGSGANSAWLLENLPDAEVVALEPSAAMRSLAIGRIASHPEWFPRISVRPEDFFSAALPPVIGGAVLLGVLGHFDQGERAAVLAELAARLPEGGAALIDLQEPVTPSRVTAFEFTGATIGQLSYKGIAEAWPIGGERMHWRMTYLTLDGERVLVEDTTEHIYRHPSPQSIATEAAQVGLHVEPAGEPSLWILSSSDTRVREAP